MRNRSRYKTAELFCGPDCSDSYYFSDEYCWLMRWACLGVSMKCSERAGLTSICVRALRIPRCSSTLLPIVDIQLLRIHSWLWINLWTTGDFSIAFILLSDIFFMRSLFEPLLQCFLYLVYLFLMIFFYGTSF